MRAHSRAHGSEGIARGSMYLINIVPSYVTSRGRRTAVRHVPSAQHRGYTRRHLSICLINIGKYEGCLRIRRHTRGRGGRLRIVVVVVVVVMSDVRNRHESEPSVLRSSVNTRCGRKRGGEGRSSRLFRISIRLALQIHFSAHKRFKRTYFTETHFAYLLPFQIVQLSWTDSITR